MQNTTTILPYFTTTLPSPKIGDRFTDAHGTTWEQRDGYCVLISLPQVAPPQALDVLRREIEEKTDVHRALHDVIELFFYERNYIMDEVSRSKAANDLLAQLFKVRI